MVKSNARVLQLVWILLYISNGSERYNMPLEHFTGKLKVLALTDQKEFLTVGLILFPSLVSFLKV